MLQEVLRYQNISDNYSVISEIHLTFCLQRDLQWSFRASLTGYRFVKVHILLVLLEFFSSENKIKLGGEEHLDSYHWERPMSELEALDRQEGAQPNQWSRSCPRW